MTEAWKTWDGQVVDGFSLLQYLGGSDHSAVYLTELNKAGAQKAAIKFIPADAAADAQMARWQVAGQLLHPNLLQLIRMGRCQMANADFLYVVMEYVEEDLSQILPQRALDAGETRQIVEATLQALGYLHGQGLAHTRIKPSNILATGDQLKISTDTLCEIGSAPLAMPRASIYAAPESASAPIAAAADVWSLGVTVVEALTQRTPVIRSQTRTELPLPETIPPPFLEIARRSVQLDPSRRANLAEISALLNPGSARKRDPLLVPQSTEVVVPETVKESGGAASFHAAAYADAAAGRYTRDERASARGQPEKKRADDAGPGGDHRDRGDPGGAANSQPLLPVAAAGGDGAAVHYTGGGNAGSSDLCGETGRNKTRRERGAQRERRHPERTGCKEDNETSDWRLRSRGGDLPGGARRIRAGAANHTWYRAREGKNACG